MVKMASEEPFDTDVFITTVQSHPSIWDYTSDSYSDRIQKTKSWEEICLTFHPDFDSKSKQEKNAIANRLQRKWKTLRDSFNREYNKKKTIKSGDGVSSRRGYIFYNQLLFLQPLAEQRSTSSSIEQEDSAEDPSPSGGHSLEEFGPAPSYRRRKRGNDSLLEELRERYESRKHEEKEKDEDTLFCLSLVPSLKDIPGDLKLDAKCELLQVLKRYRRGNISGGSSYYSMTPGTTRYPPYEYSQDRFRIPPRHQPSIRRPNLMQANSHKEGPSETPSPEASSSLASSRISDEDSIIPELF